MEHLQDFFNGFVNWEVPVSDSGKKITPVSSSYSPLTKIRIRAEEEGLVITEMWITDHTVNPDKALREIFNGPESRPAGCLLVAIQKTEFGSYAIGACQLS